MAKNPKPTEEEKEWQQYMMKEQKLSMYLNTLDAISRNSGELTAEESKSLKDPLIPKIKSAIEAL